MLLVLASVVFLGSEFIGTPDQILLSQIWDFPFRRLLRLAGSRWRYSTPPPHRCTNSSLGTSRYINSGRTPRKTPYSIVPSLGVFTDQFLSNRRPIVARVGSLGNVLTESLPSNGYIRHNIKSSISSVFIVWRISGVTENESRIGCWAVSVSSSCSGDSTFRNSTRRQTAQTAILCVAPVLLP
jgi:hypothetical protein